MCACVCVHVCDTKLRLVIAYINSHEPFNSVAICSLHYPSLVTLTSAGLVMDVSINDIALSLVKIIVILEHVSFIAISSDQYLG